MSRRWFSDRTALPIGSSELTVLRIGKHRDPRLADRFPGLEIHLDTADVDGLMKWLNERGQKRSELA